jgi:hypothetical protein
VHLSLDGQHLKTLPSQLTSIDLTKLRAQGARPAVWRAKTRYKCDDLRLRRPHAIMT